MSVRVFAPAKVNLTLQVGAPRADGLHPLQSVVVFADVGEWVEAASATTLSLRVQGPLAHGVPVDESNLVLKAARALAAAAGLEAPGAALLLHKTMPAASGIGGGSSDAAAALKALNQIWLLDFGEAKLLEVAARLGSDVPACVAARSAYMTGAGEHFSELALPPLNAILVNPMRPLPTAEVYRQFDAMLLGATFAEAPTPIWRDAASVFAGARALGNDLTAPAQALMPQLCELDALLTGDNRVRHAALSGSGATMFALVESGMDAQSFAADIGGLHPEYWVRAVQLGAKA